MKALRYCDLLANGDVVLRLDEACVQTTAKRAHAELVTACLEGEDPETRLEGPLALLGRFLRAADFGALRSQHPELAGGTGCRVRLHQAEDGTVTWETT
jgi:hypothetical protein